MNTEIYDDGTCLRIVIGGSTLIVTKSQIKTVDTLKGTTLRLDIGEGALKNIYITAADVTVPANMGGRLTDVHNAVKNMLKTTGITPAGDATAANQNAQLAQLSTIWDVLVDMRQLMLDEKVLAQPVRIDESVPQRVYRGYAGAGSDPALAVWAIERITRVNDVVLYEWADGDKVQDNIWNDRHNLEYEAV